jgi:hypothetical protein
MDQRSKIGLSTLIVFWIFILLSLAWTKAPRVGTLASTGMTATARFSHTATLLRNNQVLVAGGMERNGVWLSSAELFDPASERFIAAGNMSVPRAGATATLLNNGKVLIAGGATSAGKSLASAELFDPATGMFAVTGSMNTPRSHAVAVLLQDGKVLVAGGGTAGDDRKTDSAELYDPAQGRFIPTGSMQRPRSYDTAVRLTNGRVLVAGGMSYGDFPNPEIEASAEIFDPASGRFTATGSMGFARYKQGMALLPGGKVLVVGGQTGGPNGDRLSSTEIYDPGPGKFTRGPEMQARRFKLLDGVVTLRDGRVLVAGGADQMELYDPASGNFSTVGGVALDGFLFSTATLLGDGKVLLVNGYGSHAVEGAVRHAWVYQP